MTGSISRKLSIHVGPHKTGTTSIQRAIEKRAAALARVGIYAYDEQHSSNAAIFNCHDLAHEFLRPELRTPMRRRDGTIDFEGDYRWSRFSSKVQAQPCDHVLISAEAFSFCRTMAEQEKLTRAMAELFDEIEVLMVRRADLDWQRSWSAQVARSGLYSSPKICDEVPPEERLTAQWYFDWPELLNFWQGIGSCTVLHYDMEMARHGSVLPGFFSWIGAAPLAHGLDLHLNQSKAMTA